mmetsp:Transcript_37788/g.80727  ORF Transcript_37788/g.80727 Transcript_37788/m.80727 type:complete len:91 (-) Transcript_37788:128-400(-)
MFISVRMSLRVKEALPRRSGDGSPIRDSGWSAASAALSFAVAIIFSFGAEDAEKARRCRIAGGLMLNAETAGSVPKERKERFLGGVKRLT